MKSGKFQHYFAKVWHDITPVERSEWVFCKVLFVKIVGEWNRRELRKSKLDLTKTALLSQLHVQDKNHIVTECHYKSVHIAPNFKFDTVSTCLKKMCK